MSCLLLVFILVAILVVGKSETSLVLKILKDLGFIGEQINSEVLFLFTSRAEYPIPILEKSFDPTLDMTAWVNE